MPGAPELIIVLALVVVVFGAGKLPEVGSALGKSIREFRQTSHDEPAKAKPDELAAETTRREKAA